MWEIIGLKYGVIAQIKLFLQQLKQCPTKRKKINLVTHNQEHKKLIIIEGYLHFFLVGIKHACLY